MLELANETLAKPILDSHGAAALIDTLELLTLHSHLRTLDLNGAAIGDLHGLAINIALECFSASTELFRHFRVNCQSGL